jgi:hypothetical protein
MVSRPKKDLVEIFGYSPDDLTSEARALWALNACPFTNTHCIKTNHDNSIVYGTCSVTTPYGACVICPNRFYENGYEVLRRISKTAFGGDIGFLLYGEFVSQRKTVADCVVALGQNSGKEVKVGRQLSMDWVLAKIQDNKLVEYVGVEVQSIDITGNYRDAWYAYKNLLPSSKSTPQSAHGLNWANVHKRLIPQIIRKGRVYEKSKYVNKGLYFIVPDIVYRKFEEILGEDIPLLGEDEVTSGVLTIHTYDLSDGVAHGMQRGLIANREIHISLDEFSSRFIGGPNLPSGSELDTAVQRILGIS